MIHPLVHDAERTVRLCQMRDTVLGEHCHTIAVDQLWNTVVNLTVHVIRTACEHNTMSMSLLHPFQSFLTFFAYIETCLTKFFPGSFCSFGDLGCSHAFLAIEFFNQAVGHDLQTFKA